MFVNTAAYLAIQLFRNRAVIAVLAFFGGVVAAQYGPVQDVAAQFWLTVGSIIDAVAFWR